VAHPRIDRERTSEVAATGRPRSTSLYVYFEEDSGRGEPRRDFIGDVPSAHGRRV